MSARPGPSIAAEDPLARAERRDRRNKAIALAGLAGLAAGVASLQPPPPHRRAPAARVLAATPFAGPSLDPIPLVHGRTLSAPAAFRRAEARPLETRDARDTSPRAAPALAPRIPSARAPWRLDHTEAVLVLATAPRLPRLDPGGGDNLRPLLVSFADEGPGRTRWARQDLDEGGFTTLGLRTARRHVFLALRKVGTSLKRVF